jgi:ATP/maltotriose-dependent transcriptional regulator MalT
MSIPKTKLRPPVLRHPIVQRPRLTNTFTDRRPLTIVSAPAGSGKTTLALEWLANSDAQVAWLSLDEDDNDPIRFVNGLIASLQGAKLKIRIPSGQRDIKTIITEIINQFSEAETITLVLDDYHLITENSIHAAITYLLDHIPATLQLVLVTRETPPLPLARLRARGQLREFHISDLRFTAEETKQYLTQVMRLDLSTEKILSLAQHTQGWIAGLQMAALSLQTNHEQQIPNANEMQFITDYLLTEVFNRQPLDVQTFLLNTSLLDKFSPSLCKAVYPGDADEMLTTIERSNLFVTSLDTWYQYHPLFREFLKAQLQNKFPERVHELHGKASKWLEKNGDSAEAIPHAVANADYKTASRLIATLAPDTFQRGELVTLRRWLDLLPDSVKWTHPRLCLMQIWLLLDSNLQVEAQTHLERLSSFLENNLGGEFLAVRALHAAMTHQPELALKFAQQAQETPEARDPFIQTYVSFGLGAAQMMGINFFQAEQSFRTALSLADAAGNTYIAVSSLANLSDVQYMQARLTDAEKTCQEALKRYPDTAPDSNHWYWTLARVAYQRNEPEQALKLINRAIDLSAEWQNSSVQHARTLVQRALIQNALGKKDSAQADLDAADLMSRSLQERLVLRSVVRQRVIFALENQDSDGARRWLKTLAKHGEEPFPFYYHLTKGRVFLAEGKLKEANAAFRVALKYLDEEDYTLVRIETLIWQAVAFHGLNHISDAAKPLDEALKLAGKGQVIRPFVEAREGLLPLVGSAGIDLGRSQLAKILGNSPQAQGPVLTRRENEILQLLAIGLSNYEIAERLVIAEGTLKRHVANLYQKLGVHNRAQAIVHFKQQN